MELSAQKAHEIARQNAALRARLRTAKRKIRDLEREIERSERMSPDQADLAVLQVVAESNIETGFTVDFAEKLDVGAAARLDYHLQKLIDGGYVELLFTDSALGGNFAVTQRGRTALVKKHLL